MTRALLGLLVATATAAEIPASWMNAIESRVDEVIGIDVERLRATGSHGASLVDIPFDANRAITYVMCTSLGVCLLKTNGDPFTLAPNATRTVIRGHEILDLGDNEFMARVPGGTAILGSMPEVLSAADKLEAPPKPNPEIARLAAAYDAWIYMPRAAKFAGLDLLGETIPPLHNLRAGVRFGNTMQALVEVETESATQATALALAAKLLPTVLRNAGRTESDFAASIARFTTTSNGKTVTAEIAIPASALRLLE